MIELKYLIMSMLAVAVMGCVQDQPRPIPLGTNTTNYGYVDNGSKFGISIGQSRGAARAILEDKDYKYSGTVMCKDSSLESEIGCRSNEMFDVYDKNRGFGHETIFMHVADDRVLKIGWSFIALQLDF
jgi:hypothetical protein